MPCRLSCSCSHPDLRLRPDGKLQALRRGGGHAKNDRRVLAEFIDLGFRPRAADHWCVGGAGHVTFRPS